MKVLCLYTGSGPSYVRQGWKNVFEATGHKFVFWDPQTKPIFDAFNENDPIDLLIATTYDLDRAMFKCIQARPDMRVIMFASAWGNLVDKLDRQKYPIVYVTDHERENIIQLKKATGKPDYVFIHVTDTYRDGVIGGWESIGCKTVGILNGADIFTYFPGQYQPELACDVSFVGSRWSYKARNIDRFLLPLCQPSSGFNVKIFGASGWDVPQHLGYVDDDVVRDVFASSLVCPNISEPHSTCLEHGADTVERSFKVLSSGAFCVSDYVPEAVNHIFSNNELVFVKTPHEFRDTIYHFITHPEDRLPYITRGIKTVLQSHTYFDRVFKMLTCLGLTDHSQHCLAVKQQYISRHYAGQASSTF